MDEMAFTTPPLLTLLCFMMGSALFFGPHFWLYYKVRERIGDVSMGAFIFPLSMQALFLVTVFSAGHALYVGDIFPWAELCVLLALVIGFVVRKFKGGASKEDFFKKELPVGLLGVLKLPAVLALLWVLTLFLAFIIGQGALLGNMFVPVFNPVRDAGLIVGVGWIAALYLLYVKAGQAKAIDKGIKFHNLLGPLVLGLLFFMLPMLVQNIGNSEKLHERLNATPRLQKI